MWINCKSKTILYKIYLNVLSIIVRGRDVGNLERVALS